MRSLVVSLIHMIPGDPAQAMLGEAAPQADVEELRRQLGLDRPLVEQYVAFLRGLVKGDLGTSLRTGLPVTDQIVERMEAEKGRFSALLMGVIESAPFQKRRNSALVAGQPAQ